MPGRSHARPACCHQQASSERHENMPSTVASAGKTHILSLPGLAHDVKALIFLCSACHRAGYVLCLADNQASVGLRFKPEKLQRRFSRRDGWVETEASNRIRQEINPLRNPEAYPARREPWLSVALSNNQLPSKARFFLAASLKVVKQ
eukprot:scaffold49727_cov41-Prasinocladus_malaysianus.AAC.1